MKKCPLLLAFILTGGIARLVADATPPLPAWQHLSSRQGELPVPNGGLQQTTAVVLDVDGDGVNDFVLGERTEAPGVIWLRRTGTGWEKYMVDDGPRRTEAGGLAHDVDGDGDPDFIVGGDYKSNEVWWYENPRPAFDPATPWKRHLIKQSGVTEHHDQAMADFMRARKPQLMFWNQKAKKLFMAERPDNPRDSGPWPLTEIFDYSALEPAPVANVHPAIVQAANKQEGMSVCDIDGDGRPDLLAGMFWFKHVADKEFKAVQFADHPGRVAAGWFKAGKIPQIVLAPGDGDGALMLYECQGDPTDPKSWQGRDLLGTKVIHGHSLDLGDINGDGHLDIFTAEMGQWTNKVGAPPDNPDARAWILYGDGQGNFTPTVLSAGIGFHEARAADLDGDGKLDILNKPYRFDTPRLDIWLNQGNGPAGGAAAAPGPQGKPLKGRLGMELWTYRDALRQDLVGTLAKIRRLGFTDVETNGYYGRTAAEFRQILDQVGLTCSSIVASYPVLANGFDSVVADAKAVGATQVVVPNFPRAGGELTMDDCRRAAAAFNRWGAALKQQGISFAYHPHGFEFVRTSDGFLFDELLRLTEPVNVSFQMDVFWIYHGGGDPVHYLKQHPTRFTSLHLKDLRKGEPFGQPVGRAPNQNSVALGTGQLDFPAILSAAAAAGVSRYYLEDESPYSDQQVPVSLAYLRTLQP